MLTLLGCSSREQPRRYEVPSNGELAADADDHGSAPAADALQIDYAVPEGWKAGKRNAMRKAAWVVEDGDQKAEITVVAIAAGAEDLLASVNRWRGQISLDPTTQADLDKTVIPIQVAGAEGQFVELLGAENAEQRKCVFGVVAVHDDMEWVIKLSGDADLVRREKDRFLGFARSIRFDVADGIGPSPHGPTGDAREVPERERVTSVVTLVYDEIPNGWEQAELRGIRRAAFLVQEDKQKVLITAAELLAVEGDLLAAVNTLRSEVALGPISKDEFDQAAGRVQVAGIDAPYFELVGPEDARRPAAVLTVMVPYRDRVWFFTMKGDADLALREKERFVTFVTSVKFEVEAGVEPG